MKIMLYFMFFSSIATADDIGTQELLSHCRGAVFLAKALASEKFTATNWSLGDVTTTDSGSEHTLLPSGVQGELVIRQINVSAEALTGKNSKESKNEVQFQVKGDPYPTNLTIQTRGSFRFVRLAKWQWYDMPGFLVFRFAADAEGENAIGSPCKLPRQWRAFFIEAIALREKYSKWFLPGLKEYDLIRMQNEIVTTNPLWRLSVMCRLLELKQVHREDTRKMLQASAGKPVELGALLFFLLDDTASHEAEIMEQVRSQGRDLGTAEGLALGCLASAADKPKPVERAFDSMSLLKDLEARRDSSIKDKEKLIDEMFQGDKALDYRIAHKLNMMVVTIDSELRRKVEAILFYMLKP